MTENPADLAVIELNVDAVIFSEKLISAKVLDHSITSIVRVPTTIRIAVKNRASLE